MDVIKVEADSVDEACEYCLVDTNNEEVFVPFAFTFVKTEDTQNDPCDVTTFKEEVKKELKEEEHNVCLDRSYSTEDTLLTVATSSGKVKDEISTEEHEVSLDCIEDFINVECGTACSAADVAGSMEDNWECPGGTDPLLLETTDGSSCILPKSSGNGKNNGRKPFKCEQCFRCFTKADDLKVHSRIHTGEKPFKCDVCNKRYIRQRSLRLHSRIHAW